MTVEEELNHIIEDWHNRSGQVQEAHYEAGNYYEKMYLRLGIPVIVLSAVIGGAEVLVPVEILESLGASGAKNISGVISLLVAVLAGLQTFLKLSQRSERHRMAGARYGDCRRALEEIRITCAESSQDARQELHRIKQQIDSLASESPELQQKILNKYRHAIPEGWIYTVIFKVGEVSLGMWFCKEQGVKRF
ncbi:MAG: SLATT domain-containing protein [Motiliproteus sp.]|nr:SLATT domain-containing protein [Motiliproteus sp.]MCW9052920.1 SLATT domain-containing protein [Motiliproteus sp.]